jgi:transposase-like protein
LTSSAGITSRWTNAAFVAGAKPARVAVDETAIKINGEWSWLYAAIDLDTKLILDVQLFGRHGTDPTAAFLHGLREKHDLSDAVFLVDQFGYRTAVARLGLNGQVDYTDRNLIEKVVSHAQNAHRPFPQLVGRQSVERMPVD